MKKILPPLLLSLSVLSISVATATEHRVDMLSWGKDGPMVYEPSVLRIDVGDTVTFFPQQPGHQVKSHTIPEGAESFLSELDEQYSITLTKEGIYVYICPPHYSMNMSGLIQVGDPINRTEIDVAVKTIESEVSMNKKRLTGYLKKLDEMNTTGTEKTDSKASEEPTKP